ncbi:PP2C family serine/threonine-protein phosphatase [Bacillus tianshenii]|nr:PP2C family serine/threonine-protein phosphatase [Bacillus tianshenii]
MIIEKYDNVDIAAYQRAKKGQTCCGDSYFMVETKGYFVCAVADGLGSGPEAKKSSEAAIQVVKRCHSGDVQTIMEECNRTLTGKRGAVLGLLKVDYEKREIVYSSVGNIRFILYSPTGKITYPLPKSGYLSGRPVDIPVQQIAYEEDSTFLIHSDGLQLKSLKKVIWKMTSPEVASTELKKYVAEGLDDTTFIVGKIHSS